MASRFLSTWVVLCLFMLQIVKGFPQQGKWNLKLNSSDIGQYNGVAKNLYKDTKVFIRVNCHPTADKNTEITIGWILRETQCWNDFAFIEAQQEPVFESYYKHPSLQLPDSLVNTSANYLRVMEQKFKCEDHNPIVLVSENIDDHLVDYTKGEHDGSPVNKKDTSPEDSSNNNQQKARAERSKDDTQLKQSEDTTSSDATKRSSGVTFPNTNSGPNTRLPQYTLKHDGDYLFVIHIGGSSFQAEVELEMQGPSGYLSIVDWPLLPFYGVMCGIYVCMGIGWLVVSGMHWRDLLRIQFWIGGVIFLGMLEKAMFYGEFQNINSTGTSTKGLILLAEIVSCAKRTLARMLVIIVSLGFGIVKPRLGPTLHRVVGIGGLYFALASTEAYLRVMKPKNDVSTGTLLAGIPLAVIDSSICWWVFSALVQTTRTLRLRRNVVKLSLYRHFTHVLIFAVLSSVVFMLWSIKFHKMEGCLTDWRDLWVDEAFWHLLFSILLLCIMILWTPSKNNQRYAFTPLLDAEDDEEDEEDEAYYTDAFDGMKQRMTTLNGKTDKMEKGGVDPEEDPLKWIEENIPESAETENPLPVIDSDEEIETTKFEISKMQ